MRIQREVAVSDWKGNPFVPPRKPSLALTPKDTLSHRRVVVLERLEGRPKRDRERLVIRDELAGDIEI